MISRSSEGRLAATVFSRSRNFVTVRTLVAICWRKVAMFDYSAIQSGFPCKGIRRAELEKPIFRRPRTLIQLALLGFTKVLHEGVGFLHLGFESGAGFALFLQLAHQL